MRSEFAALAVAGTVMGGALLGGAGDAQAEGPPVATPLSVVPPGAKFALDLGDGQNSGWLTDVSGGSKVADVVNEKIGPDLIQQKHLAGVKYEDITVTTGTGMSKAYYEWIKASFARQYPRKSGAIIAADYNYKELTRIEFKNALISEIGMPALDAASKDAAKMTIKFSPEFTKVERKAGSSNAGGTSPPSAQKHWLPSNFRFDYAGCGDPCKGAVKIAQVTVKLGGPPPQGQAAPPHRISNIVVTMPPAQDMPKWAVDGSSRDGILEYRAADGSVLLAFKLTGMRLVRLTPQAQGNRPTVEIELQPRSIEPGPS
jgi:phage tail-like protein